MHEYADRVGFGHSSIEQTLKFAALAGAARVVPFHHDPGHSDDDLDRLLAEAASDADPALTVLPGQEGAIFDLAAQAEASKAEA